MFFPQNIQFLLNLDTILAGKLILEQALPAFATGYVTAVIVVNCCMVYGLYGSFTGQLVKRKSSLRKYVLNSISNRFNSDLCSRVM